MLPRQWVVREVSKDYGHDLEVEIFGEGDRSTGLTFRVQMKATQSASEALELSFSTEHLYYYDGFEVPTAIVRYVSETDAYYLIWHFNVGERHKWGNQKTITIKWSEADKISGSSAQSIYRTVELLRSLRGVPPPCYVTLERHCTDGVPSELRYRFCRAVDCILDVHDIFHSGHKDIRSVPVDVLLEGETVRVSIDCMMSVAFVWEGEAEELVSAVLYIVGTFAYRLGITRIAEAVALQCLVDERVSCAQQLAVQVCLSLLGKPSCAVELAKLNKLEHAEPFQIIFLTALFEEAPSQELRRGVLSFFDAMDQCADSHTRRATALYSRANFLLAQGEPRAAFSALNQAHRLRPAYWKSPYFLKALATSLHLSGRFKLASIVYDWAARLKPTAHTLCCLADSLLFCGEFAHAEELFSTIIDADDEPDQSPSEGDAFSDTIIRHEVSRWLRARYGDRHERRQSALDKLPFTSAPGERADLEKRLELDPLDPLANFNLGVDLAGKDPSSIDAAIAFWIVGLVNVVDAESWSNALLCFLNKNDPHGISLSIYQLLRHCGADGHDHIRSVFLSQGVPESLVQSVDDAFSGQIDRNRRAKPVEAKTVVEVFEKEVLHIELFRRQRKIQ